MQHRIIVVDTRPGVPVAEAQRHWRERHAAVYLPTPLLAGYVQNRPLEEEWERLGSRSICSETWFADHDAEKNSFASDFMTSAIRGLPGVPWLLQPAKGIASRSAQASVQSTRGAM